MANPPNPDNDPRWQTLGAQQPAATAATPPSAQPAQPPGGGPPASQDDPRWGTLGTATTPVGAATGRTIAEGAQPGFSIQADINTATDPEQRRRIAASVLFPSLKPVDAQSRVFYSDSGRLAATDPKGNAYYIDPPSFSIFDPSTWQPTVRAGAATPAMLPAAGAVVGGFAGGMPGALAGTAAGDIGRQEIANALDPKGGWRFNPLQTGVETAGTAAGEVGGRVLLPLLARNPLGADLTGMTAADLAAAQQRAGQAYTQAGAQGIPLTPGQASRLPGVLSTEDVYGSGSLGPAQMQQARNFYAAQSDAIRARQGQIFAGLATTTDPTEAAQQFQAGAVAADRAARQQANMAAQPYYQAAQAGGQVVSPDLAQLAETPAVQAAMNAARTDYQNLYRTAAPDTPDFNLWDLTKRRLDDAYSVASRAGERTQATSIDTLRQDLLTHLDAAYPDYAQARATAAPGQQLSARLQEVTRVGGAPSLGNERAREIVRPVFETNNARSISEARNAFIAAGREGDWNNGVAAYLQDQFDTASKSQDGLNPSMLLRSIWRDPNKRAAIQAAMDPGQFQGFQSFMQTLENVAQSRGMNSLTTPRAAGAAALTEAATPTAARALTTGANILSPWRLADLPGKAADYIAGNLTQRNISQIGQRIFSPDGMQFLNRMRIVPPGSREAILATSRFFGQQAGAEGGEPRMPTASTGNPLTPPGASPSNPLTPPGP